MTKPSTTYINYHINRALAKGLPREVGVQRAHEAWGRTNQGIKP